MAESGQEGSSCPPTEDDALYSLDSECCIEGRHVTEDEKLLSWKPNGRAESGILTSQAPQPACWIRTEGRLRFSTSTGKPLEHVLDGPHDEGADAGATAPAELRASDALQGQKTEKDVVRDINKCKTKAALRELIDQQGLSWSKNATAAELKNDLLEHGMKDVPCRRPD